MSVTQIDLGDDALAEAMRLSGARSKKETVNLALREYAARRRRIAALDHYAAVAQGWDYEGWKAMCEASKAPAVLCRPSDLCVCGHPRPGGLAR